VETTETRESNLLAEAFDEKEAETVLQTLSLVVPMIANVFGPDCEIVVHDLRRPERSIVALENGQVTNREIGGPLVGGPFGDVALRWLNEYDDRNRLRVYETHTRDGKQLKSATLLLRTTKGKPFAALCINLDISAALAVSRWLGALVRIDSGGSRTLKSPNPPDVDDILTELISDSLSLVPMPPTELSKDQRFRVVQELDEKGAFLVRGAVRKVAKVLGVSRHTIYSYLDELRNGQDAS
jgi:predicted transcriptional regulator YheO